MLKDRLIQFIALLCISVSGFAQENGDFETYNGTNSGFAFSDGAVAHWKHSHGTPSLVGGGPVGSRAAWMWAYIGAGEGIVQKYNFEKGEQYQLKFWVRTNNPMGTIFVKAANGVPYGVTAQNEQGLPVVTSQQTIFHDGMNYSNWQEITVEFAPDTDYEHLWIYPFLGAGVGSIQAEFMIDGIRISKQKCYTASVNYATNHSFENLTGTQLNNAFALGQVVDWKQSHGRPEIKNTDAHSGNHSAWMSASTWSSSGILKNVVFRSGKQYRIRLWIKGSTQANAQVLIKLAKGVPSSPFPLFPNGNISSQTVYNELLRYDDWTEVRMVFTPDTYYNQLWIHPNVSENTNIEFGIDEVTVEEVSCNYETVYSRSTRQQVTISEGPQVLDANVYPNPVTKTIKLTLPATTKQAKVSLLNASTGQKVASFVATPTRKEWPVPANLKNGVYLIIITDSANHLTKTTRIVVNQK